MVPAVGTNEPMKSLSAYPAVAQVVTGAPAVADPPKHGVGSRLLSKDGKPRGYRRFGTLSRQPHTNGAGPLGVSRSRGGNFCNYESVRAIQFRRSSGGSS